MARKSHPFAQVGRPAAVKAPPPVKLASGERQGASPMDNFRSSVPAQTYAKGGAIKYHDDPSFGWGPKGKRGC